MILLLVITLIPVNAFASVNENTAELNTGRHYTVKEEVVSDRITTKTYIYPCDVIPGGANAKEATVRAVCYSEYHYRVYRKRVGDPDYKAFLYDEYKTDWKGQWRYNSSSTTWLDDPEHPRKTETTKERSPIYGVFLSLFPTGIVTGEEAK